MFTNTIDKKPIINNPNDNNEIVDLTKSIFSKEAAGLDTYTTVKLDNHFQMRGDKVAFHEYGTDNYTEYILKYSGVSNPFSIDGDDVLFIPDPEEAKAQMTSDIEEETKAADQVKIYYKFTNKDFKSDSTSYDNLTNKKIESGKPKQGPAEFNVPYITDEGTAITIKNGRMYFGMDAGNVADPAEYAEKLVTELDKKCATNGMSLTDFVRASIVNAGKNE